MNAAGMRKNGGRFPAIAPETRTLPRTFAIPGRRCGRKVGRR